MKTNLLSTMKSFFSPTAPIIAMLFIVAMLPSETWGQLDSIHYFPPIHSRQNGQIAQQYIYLSTPEITPFDVTIEDGAGNFLGTVTISKDDPDYFYVGSGQVPGTDVAVPKDSCATVLRGSGFVASAPYDFYCNVRVKAGYHATSIACKGRAALGREFYAGSMPQVVSNTNRNFCTSIMATEDGTVVNIAGYDTDVIFEAPVGVIYSDVLTILMNEGDCFVLTGYTTTTMENMTGFIGARITSNQDIVVNTGNYLGSISAEGYQDGGMVQIVPTPLLGTEHVVVEGLGGPVLERPLVLATEDGTEVYINDIAAPVTTIDEGEYYLVPSTYYSGTLHGNMAITTNHPIYLFQATAATTSSATSEFNFIPPLECYLSETIDAIPDIDRIGGTVYDGMLYIITTTGSTVTVNGSVLGGATGPEPAIGLPDWETYSLSMTGDVAIESSGAMAAGFIAVNGFAGAGAYYAGFTFDFQVDAGPELHLCEGDTALLYGTGAGPDGVYTWDLGVSDSVAFVPGTTMTYTVVGTNIEGCEDDDSVVVNVYEMALSNAGFDQDLCDTNATTLNGNLPLETGSGLWSVASGPGTPSFEEPEDPFSEIYGLEEGTYEVVWTVVNGTCPEVTDTMLINVYDMPFSNAGPDQNLCNEYATALLANVPAGTATGLWTVASGPSTPTFSDDTNPITPISDLVEGTYELIWTVSNGTCIPDADTMFIHVYDLPTSAAGPDQELCAIYTTDLAGSSPLGTATGLWSMESGPGAATISDPTDSTTTIDDLEEGVYEFVWTVSNGTCPPVTDTVSVTVYDTPVSNAGPDQDICDISTTTLAGNVPTGTSSGIWSYYSGPTVVSFTDATLSNTNVTGLSLGTYELVWTVSNGTCDPATDTITITVHPEPTIDILASQVLGCDPLEVAFTNLSSPVGDDCFWEFGDGSVSYECGDVIHAYPPGTFDVTLTVTANGCTSTETFDDYITSVPYPVADFGIFPKIIDITNTKVSFKNYSENAIYYTWDFGDETALNGEFEPTHTYPETIDGVYEVVLIAENDLECADTAYGTVAFEDLLIFYIPNAFTPDGTGRNDVFSPVFTSRVDPYNFNMKIFNRWGELIFETYNMNVGWDGIYNGVLVEDGVYVWQIEFSDTSTDLRRSYKGHVTVLK